MTFTKEDRILYDILKKASKEELLSLSQFIGKQKFSDISETCTDPYEIAKSIQLMGGTTAMNKIRGHGVRYRELALDAANKMGAKPNKNDDIFDIEWALMETLTDDLEEKLGKDNREKYIENVIANSSTKSVTIRDGIVRDRAFNILKKEGGSIHAVSSLAKDAFKNIPERLGSDALIGVPYSMTILCVAIIGAIRARQIKETVIDELNEGIKIAY